MQSMLNKYLHRLHKLVSGYRDVELAQFQGPEGKQAEFNDLIWYHNDPNTGRKTRYLCCKHGTKGKGDLVNKCREDLELTPTYSQLLKVWIVETVNEPISASEKQSRVATARKLFSLMNGDLYCQTEETLKEIMKGRRDNDRLRPFIKFCSENGLMPELKLQSNDNRDRTGHAQLDSELSKLPSIESVLALGDIFKRAFEHVNADGSIEPGKEVPVVDAMVATFTCLSLASPNRAIAEITVLRKQRLQFYAENQGDPVHFLDWVGSKGYKDYKNHILAALKEPVEKALNFFCRICEPARILCRFYQRPNQSLKDLLGGFEVEAGRLQHISLTASPNIFQLGYALGFYGIDDKVYVLKKGADPASCYQSKRSQFFEEKPIYWLSNEDKLSVSWHSNSKNCSYSSLAPLFKFSPNKSPFHENLLISVRDVQLWWISYFTKTLVPEFPRSYSTSESHIKLEDAMFCFLGDWFYGRGVGNGRGGKGFQASPYAVVPLHALGSFVTTRLTGSGSSKAIFDDYGFSSEIRVRPHSLRHFGNTLADMSGIPVEVITAWSGRVNPEQTHTYIHTSQEEKASRVRAIINPPSIDSRNIRVVSASKLTQAVNMPASVTSTGICTQDLHVTPCNYLNDFVAQCFMCPDSCHIADDEESIAFLEKDLALQSARLETVSEDPRLANSQAMKKWYEIHSRNSYILSMLISLMKESPKGTVIRFSKGKSEFSLIELNSNIITRVACAIPNTEARLKRLLEHKSQNTEHSCNPQLHSLLSTFGLSEKES